jgi:hypothetical protein
MIDRFFMIGFGCSWDWDNAEDVHDGQSFYTDSGRILFHAFQRRHHTTRGIQYTERPSHTEGRKYGTLGRVVEWLHAPRKHSK